MKITGAPGCWGIEDTTNPYNPAYQKVLDEASLAGYTGIELGPYGYLPTDTSILNRELAIRHLKIIAGTMYDELSIAANREYLIAKTHQICQILSNLEAEITPEDQLSFSPPYLVVIDAVNPQRSKTAGLPDEAIRLDDQAWDTLVDNIVAICLVAKSYGIRPVLHPHAGGFIEFADEIDKIAADIGNNIMGFCLDTGHLYYSKMNPVEWLDKYYCRLDYIHFKDINYDIYQTEIANHTGFFEACALGVMCPIGTGCIDYAAIYDFLIAKDYKGYITIEQERDPRDSSNSLADVKASVNYLKKIGYQTNM
ncbi:TIM barrel protein [Candidatus Epulonipiscium viviparus]|uniref:TIM barrel protein n=1 Tax=Candidatus Epulonipiscium viviparus TaxID=420336 RepID=UPI0027380C19|nr:TIM barrel protein [Candidatus Epulopiscium viviparus]